MKQNVPEMTKNKKRILEEIKKPYRIKPITAIIVLVLTVISFMIIISAVGDFGRKLTSDFVGALISLFFALNLGLGFYQGIWRFLNSRKINKVLFPKLEQLINENDEKSYDETEAEAYVMVKEAYADYTVKYNNLNKIYRTSIKLSFVFPLIAMVIWLVSHQL
jgi:uncharacterized membrane protein YoaT (DUF817 family)